MTPRKHGVVDNTVTERCTGKRFHITNLPRRESVRVPTLFDAVKKAGLCSCSRAPASRQGGRWVA